MTIHLYQQTPYEVFRLSERTLKNLGYKLHYADDLKGLISASKEVSRSTHFCFFDVHVTPQKYGSRLSLISNIFSGNSGTFISDTVSEELFLETFHDLMRIQQPDNPMKLTFNDYAMAVGF